MKRSEVLELAKEVWGDTSGKPWSDSAIGHLQMFATLVEEQTMTRQKAKYYQQGYEAASFVAASSQPLVDEIKRLRDLNRQLMGESA